MEDDFLRRIRDDLRSKRGRAREVSEATGLPLSTLYRLREGDQNPTYRVVESLREFYVRAKRRQPEGAKAA